MSAPRLELDLDKIHHNARSLAAVLAERGISVTGITKATSGLPGVASALLRAGVRRFGDSRIENIRSMRRAGIAAPMTLIRSPMPSQVGQVVAFADVSFNTEIDVMRSLSRAARAAGRIHGVVLMVELGDLREGIMPGDVERVARQASSLPNLVVRGLGANLACRSGVAPDDRNMSELSQLARSVEAKLGLSMEIVSGGNSATLEWALAVEDPGRINDLRLGESILLGREPLHRRPIDGLHVDAITVVAEVIEAKVKPSRPWGTLAQTAFGIVPRPADRGDVFQAILAIGRQDIDPDDLTPPAGVEILGASSDHLIVSTPGGALALGDELRFQPGYGALLRATTSAYVKKVLTSRAEEQVAVAGTGDRTPGLRAALREVGSAAV